MIRYYTTLEIYIMQHAGKIWYNVIITLRKDDLLG